MYGGSDKACMYGVLDKACVGIVCQIRPVYVGHFQSKVQVGFGCFQQQKFLYKNIIIFDNMAPTECQLRLDM